MRSPFRRFVVFVAATAAVAAVAHLGKPRRVHRRVRRIVDNYWRFVAEIDETAARVDALGKAVERAAERCLADQSGVPAARQAPTTAGDSTAYGTKAEQQAVLEVRQRELARLAADLDSEELRLAGLLNQLDGATFAAEASIRRVAFGYLDTCVIDGYVRHLGAGVPLAEIEAARREIRSGQVVSGEELRPRIQGV